MSLHDAESTMMSVLCGAASTDEAMRRVYMTRFCHQYNEPLVNYLRLARTIPLETAEDVVQEFWTSKLIAPGTDENFIAKYLAKRAENSTIGFRQYLGRSLNNFFIDHVRRRERRIDNLSLEAIEGLDPHIEASERDFDDVWASHLLNDVVSAVRLECERQGQLNMWNLFVDVTLGQSSSNPHISLADLAARHGFETAKQASNALQTISRKLRRTLQSRVARYLPTDGSMDAAAAERDEMQQLLQILSRPGSVSLESLLADSASSQSGTNELSLFELSRIDVRFRLTHLTRTESEYSGLWLTFMDQTLAQWLANSASDCDLPWQSIRLSELATVSKPNLELLKLIRHEAKRFGTLDAALSRHVSAEEAIPVEFFSVIYLTAIAIARIQHSERLTTSGDSELKRRVEVTLQYGWLDQRSAELFTDLMTML